MHKADIIILGGELLEIYFNQRGYLFLATESMVPYFEKQLKKQHKYGVSSELKFHARIIEYYS